MSEFIAAVRWLLGIEPKATADRPTPRPRAGEWRTTATGGWEWVEQTYREPPEWLTK